MVMYSAGLTLQYDRMSIHTAEETTLFDDLHLCPQANLMWMINPQKGKDARLYVSMYRQRYAI